MYQKERLERLERLVEEHGYVTVKFLMEKLHYSKATINRDLNTLEQMEKIKRTWGGAEPMKPKAIPVTFRYEYGKPKKKRIAKRAAELIGEDETIFIDGSTTAQYLCEYLPEKKGLHVLTNNIALAISLAERGVAVTVLGGRILEEPYMLSGIDTVETAMRYRADHCFFSTRDVTEEGEMSYTDDIYFSLHRTMMRNSKHVVYLVDSDKIDRRNGSVILGDFSLVNTVVSDHRFSEKTKKTYPQVNFITIE